VVVRGGVWGCIQITNFICYACIIGTDDNITIIGIYSNNNKSNNINIYHAHEMVHCKCG